MTSVLCSSKSSDDNDTDTTTATTITTFTRRQSCKEGNLYLFKTDDDCYVNTTQIRLELTTSTTTTTTQNTTTSSKTSTIDYYGEPSLKTPPDRNRTSKFYISEEEFPAKYYPPYAYGLGYAVSYKFAICASGLMKNIRRQPPWEDVATGILARKCSIKLTKAVWKLEQMKVPAELFWFPYNILVNGGVNVTVLHAVKPQWMLRIHNKQPLL